MTQTCVTHVLLLYFLCISGCVSAAEDDAGKDILNTVTSTEEPVTTGERNGGQEPLLTTVSPSVADLASAGLVELIERIKLFSSSLNVSRPEPISGGGNNEGGEDLGEAKVEEGLVELTHRMQLLSEALTNKLQTHVASGDPPRPSLATNNHEKKVQKSSMTGESPSENSVASGLVDLIKRLTLFSSSLSLSSTKPSPAVGSAADAGGSAEDYGDPQVVEGLVEFIRRMQLLSESLTDKHQTPRSSLPLPSHATTNTSPFSTTTTSTTSTTEYIYPPCEPPFEEIAYRMCILQEMTLRLSWSDAGEYCRKRGAELAKDGVVIKTRRVLNDLYGEEGTRVRWPVWVGARSSGSAWEWEGAAEVANFMWAPSEPRRYTGRQAPKGTCMILDGYRRFYGASLPCHLRRRFVCQRID